MSCECEDELLERDREIEQLNESHEALERQVEALEEERDKYKASLEEIEDAARKALP